MTTILGFGGDQEELQILGLRCEVPKSRVTHVPNSSYDPLPMLDPVDLATRTQGTIKQVRRDVTALMGSRAWQTHTSHQQCILVGPSLSH